MVMPPEAARGLAAISALPVDLPAGRLIHGNEGSDDLPALWVSEAPATAQLWADLRRAHRHSGLWPLLLDSLHDDDRRPWDDGELWPSDVSRPSDFDPEELLAEWWSKYDNPSAQERAAATAPVRPAMARPGGRRPGPPRPGHTRGSVRGRTAG